MKRMARMATRKPHSWWWDSHISPKNSKWLADNLEDMNRCVKEMLKLIEEEGDSFARKAEMYYQSRPKLITHVEDFYRMYRALAERYDNVTGELRRNIPSELQSQGSGNVDEKLIEENPSSGAEEVEQSLEKNQVPELEELIAEMEAEISQHKHVIDELKSENSLLEAKLTEQEQMILELQYDVASAAEGFLQEKSSLEAQVSDVSLSNASLEAKVISLGDEIKKLEAENGKNIEKLNTNVETLERKVEKLTSEKEELGAKVSALVTDVKFRDEHLRQLLGWLNRSTFR